MLFNSLQFAIFFIIVYILYLFLTHRQQNWLLLLASCIFYAAWDWKFLLLIFISITTDYYCSLKIHASDDHKARNRFLILSVLVNLSILGFFKYFNFFASNIKALLGYFGFSVHPILLHIVLPLGISFYTFRTMSYTFDVYTDKIKPTRSYPDYALFVSFFPLLIAGPIMRAKDLLPQIASPRKLRLDSFYEGCYLVFWGLFQKVFIADNLAKIVDPVFNAGPPYSGAGVLVGIYAFTFQIYCDFAGYSNMARGLGKYMGFDIIINFNLPYFATNPQDFWNRWHISLSTWLRDYIYTPVAFSKRYWGKWGMVFALMVTFVFCGLWHGAAWTFVLWGAYQGILFAAYKLLQPLLLRIPEPKDVAQKKLWFFVRVLLFFHLTCLGWLIFRSHSAAQVLEMLRSVLFNPHLVPTIGLKFASLKIMFSLSIFIIIELMLFWKDDLKVAMNHNKLVVKITNLFKELWDFLKVRKRYWLIPFIAFLLLLILLIISMGPISTQPFIYSQF